MLTFHIIWTTLLFLIFIGIIFWAFNKEQKKSFAEASRIPLEEDEAPTTHKDRS